MNKIWIKPILSDYIEHKSCKRAVRYCFIVIMIAAPAFQHDNCCHIWIFQFWTPLKLKFCEPFCTFLKKILLEVVVCSVQNGSFKFKIYQHTPKPGEIARTTVSHSSSKICTPDKWTYMGAMSVLLSPCSFLSVLDTGHMMTLGLLVQTRAASNLYIVLVDLTSCFTQFVLIKVQLMMIIIIIMVLG